MRYHPSIYCPLVFGQGGSAIGVLSKLTVIAQPSETWTLTFAGDCQPREKEQTHYRDIILILVRESLEPEIPPQQFTVNFGNIAAASIADTHFHFSGYSADVALYIVLIAAACGIELDSHLVATGHLGSLSGEISPVSQLKTKIETARRQLPKAKILHPGTTLDDSHKILRSELYLQDLFAKTGFSKSYQLKPIENTKDTLASSITPIQTTLAALKRFQPLRAQNSFLFPNLEQAFYESLRAQLLESEDISELLDCWRKYWRHWGYSPANYPKRVADLLQQLPLTIKNNIDYTNGFQADERKALDSYFPPEPEPSPQKTAFKDISPTTKQILEDLNPTKLKLQFERPVSEAKVQFVYPEGYQDYPLDTVVQCYAHILKALGECDGRNIHAIELQVVDTLQKRHPNMTTFYEEALVSPARTCQHAIEYLCRTLVQERTQAHIHVYLENLAHTLGWDEILSVTTDLLGILEQKGIVAGADPRQYVKDFAELSRLLTKDTFSRA